MHDAFQAHFNSVYYAKVSKFKTIINISYSPLIIVATVPWLVHDLIIIEKIQRNLSVIQN